MREKEREGSTKGKGGLYKMPQIPTLPPKWPRSGATFHFMPSAHHEAELIQRLILSGLATTFLFLCIPSRVRAEKTCINILEK